MSKSFCGNCGYIGQGDTANETEAKCPRCGTTLTQPEERKPLETSRPPGFGTSPTSSRSRRRTGWGN